MSSESHARSKIKALDSEGIHFTLLSAKASTDVLEAPLPESKFQRLLCQIFLPLISRFCFCENDAGMSVVRWSVHPWIKSIWRNLEWRTDRFRIAQVPDIGITIVGIYGMIVFLLGAIAMLFTPAIQFITWVIIGFTIPVFFMLMEITVVKMLEDSIPK
jgi:hypothetical protein